MPVYFAVRARLMRSIESGSLAGMAVAAMRRPSTWIATAGFAVASTNHRPVAPRTERTNVSSASTMIQMVVRWAGPSGAWVSISISSASRIRARSSGSKLIGVSVAQGRASVRCGSVAAGDASRQAPRRKARRTASSFSRRTSMVRAAGRRSDSETNARCLPGSFLAESAGSSAPPRGAPAHSEVQRVIPFHLRTVVRRWGPASATVALLVASILPAAASAASVPGTIIVYQDTVPDGPQDFRYNVAGNEFVLDDDPLSIAPNQQTISDLAPGTYPLIQDGVTGWAVNVSCIDPDGGTYSITRGVNV